MQERVTAKFAFAVMERKEEEACNGCDFEDKQEEKWQQEALAMRVMNDE